MATNYHHGVTVTETTDLSTMITDIDSAVIGVVCTADDADETAFPLDTPVLITRVANMLGKAGKTGTLFTTLKAISDQTSPQTIVIRVADASKLFRQKAAPRRHRINWLLAAPMQTDALPACTRCCLPKCA
jgi:phage tail sheath protein FI